MPPVSALRLWEKSHELEPRIARRWAEYWTHDLPKTKRVYHTFIGEIKSSLVCFNYGYVVNGDLFILNEDAFIHLLWNTNLFYRDNSNSSLKHQRFWLWIGRSQSEFMPGYRVSWGFHGFSWVLPGELRYNRQQLLPSAYMSGRYM